MRLAFVPPYCASRRCHVDFAISRCRHTSSRTISAGEQLVALGEPADDLRGAYGGDVVAAVLTPAPHPGSIALAHRAGDAGRATDGTGGAAAQARAHQSPCSRLHHG